MYRQLKKRFIAYAMLIVTIVLVTLVGLINAASYRAMIQRADDITLLITENRGSFPKDLSVRLNTMERYGLSAESPYSTRYFSVFSSPVRDILTTNRDNLVSISGEEIQQLLFHVMQGDRALGSEGNFRYRRTTFQDGTLAVFLDMTEPQNFFAQTLRNSLTMLAAALLLVFGLIWLLAGKVVRPIAETIEKQKIFVNDAGHELKTPLAVIASSADVLELTHGKNQWTDSIRRQVERMNHLVGDMLTLSRYEQSPSLKLGPVDLSCILEQITAELSPLLERKQQHLTVRLPRPFHAQGDEESLKILFRILLDNAIRYTEPGETIELTGSLGHSETLLEWTNPFPDFPEDQLEAIFERFYRSDASRSRNSGGSGIGLALARRLAEANDGSLIALKPNESHLQFQLKLRLKK